MEDGSEYGDEMGMAGDGGMGPEGIKLAKKRKKKKKKKKRPPEFEDPSLREHLLAGAYGGVAKPKPKRQGIKYTTDINAGLRDITTPGNMRKEYSRKNIHGAGGAMSGHEGADSNRKRRHGTMNRSGYDDEDGSNLGMGESQKKSAGQLLNP